MAYYISCKKMGFSASLNKLISLEGEMSTPRTMKAGVPQDSVLSPILFNMYINNTPQTTSVHLALFADDICLCATERKEGSVLRKLQRELNSMAEWSKRWNIKINENKT
jgi:hypothetical protein